LSRDYLWDEAVFAHYYPGLPSGDETLVRFYALLALVPKLVKLDLAVGGGDLDEMAVRAGKKAAVEAMLKGIGDGATSDGPKPRP
jgi:hypothetical protein